MSDLERIRELVRQGREDELAEALAAVHPADLASVLRGLPNPHRLLVFRRLERERAGAVLSELDDETLTELVSALGDTEVSVILDRMPADHAAEVVHELEDEQAEKLLDLMGEKKSEKVEELLEYPEQTAGRLMSPDVVAVHEVTTVGAAIEYIRRAASHDRAFELYVLDDHKHLVGVVPPRRLLTADPATPVGQIREDVVSVEPLTDQEDVARLVAKYDLVSVPVVDANQRLLGTISVEDVIDIVSEEASEDIFRLAGSDAGELERRAPSRIALLRLPWVLATLFIELGAGVVIHFFDETLSQVILLASFMPVIQAISGNTGLQSVTMVVRGLATGHVLLAHWRDPLWRQIQTSSILGGVCGAVVGVIGWLWHGTVAFGLTVGCSMFVSVNLSGLAGTGIPLLSKRLGFDPAMTAGPFETAFQDVVGVTIFLSLATALLRWLTI